VTGLRSRIGERRRQDAAISIALMVEMQARLEAKLNRMASSTDPQDLRHSAEKRSFFELMYCGSMRGFETPKVLLHDLRKQMVTPDEAKGMTEQGNKTPAHASVPLQGCFKATPQEAQ
jgi:hypothetical protein